MLRALRRHIEEPEPAKPKILRDAVTRGLRQTRVVCRCRNTASTERGNLILHQRDQWRNDHGKSMARGGRKLKAERLALTGRHDRQHVVALQDRLDDGLLPRPKLLEAELLVKMLLQIEGIGPVEEAQRHGRGVYNKKSPPV